MSSHLMVAFLLLGLSINLALGLPAKGLPSQTGRRVHPVLKPAAKSAGVAQASDLRHISAALRPGYQTKGIDYFGGRVLTEGVNVYLVWYGNWSQTAANSKSQRIIREFINHLGETPTRSGNTVGGWWKINSLYYNYTAFINSKKIRIAGEFTDKYSRGKSLGFSGASTVARRLVGTRKIPNDPQALILVLTSPDVKEGIQSSGFCSEYCGWHDYYKSGSYLFQYGFIGNAATQCSPSCITLGVRTSPPNGDRGADGMISVIAHELTEAVTDPNLDAWYDTFYGENADICAWEFGAAGRNYNLIANNGAKYMVQKNWDPYRGTCTLSV